MALLLITFNFSLPPDEDPWSVVVASNIQASRNLGKAALKSKAASPSMLPLRFGISANECAHILKMQ
jgi:hypothetical protein